MRALASAKLIQCVSKKAHLEQHEVRGAQVLRQESIHTVFNPLGTRGSKGACAGHKMALRGPLDDQKLKLLIGVGMVAVASQESSGESSMSLQCMQSRDCQQRAVVMHVWRR